MPAHPDRKRRSSLVFDLRDNGGGILEDAINCIDLIAPEHGGLRRG